MIKSKRPCEIIYKSHDCELNKYIKKSDLLIDDIVKYDRIATLLQTRLDKIFYRFCNYINKNEYNGINPCCDKKFTRGFFQCPKEWRKYKSFPCFETYFIYDHCKKIYDLEIRHHILKFIILNHYII